MKEYSKMLEDTLLFGDWKDNRTGIRCLTSTPKFFEHNMANGFPLLTQKQVSFKNIAVELEAFISGITDKRWLMERGCNIWNEGGRLCQEQGQSPMCKVHGPRKSQTNCCV